MINTQLDISKNFAIFIEKRLEEELEFEFAEAKKRFEAKKSEIIAGLLIKVSKTVDVRLMENKIVVEVKTN